MAEIIPLHIGGADVYGNNDNVFDVSSPFKAGEVLYQVQGATLDDVDRAVVSSQKAFEQWKKMESSKKREVFVKVANELEKKKDFFQDIMIQMGVSPAFALFNINTTIGIVKEALNLFHEPNGMIPLSEPGSYAVVINEPIGPVLSIVPWNAPMILCMRALVGPLVAGCSVVLKTSEQSPLVHQELARLFSENGAPLGLINTIHHSTSDAATITSALIGARQIKKINFTGSTGVGRIIAQTAAKHLKPVLLELGGKCTAVVTESADLEKAAATIIRGAWLHNGQICMSTERAFVVENVYDDFMKTVLRLAPGISDAMKGLPQRTLLQAERIEGLVKGAVKGGAKLTFGSLERKDCYLEPMILTEVTDDHDLYESETFGPVVFISKVASTAEAVEALNDSDYGLSCSVWSSDILKALELASSIESGAVHINGGTVHDEPTLPHGGRKASGYGRFNSRWGISEFQVAKTITIGK